MGLCNGWFMHTLCAENIGYVPNNNIFYRIYVICYQEKKKEVGLQ